MRICDLISPADVLVRLKTVDKGQLIETLVDRAAKATGLSVADVAEEGLGSTGVGNGIAIPHARLPTLIKPHGILACLASPVEYAAIDEQPHSSRSNFLRWPKLRDFCATRIFKPFCGAPYPRRLSTAAYATLRKNILSGPKPDFSSDLLR
jgi:hypothetical protein